MCLAEELRVGRVLQGEHANKALCGLEECSVENGQSFECGFSPDLLVEVIATKTGRKEIIIPEVNEDTIFLLSSYFGFQQREVISRFLAASKLNLHKGKRLPSMSLNSSD